MDIGVVAIGDLLAIHAVIAAIDSHAVLAANGLKAIQGFGERSGDGFDFAEFVAGEKIGVREAAALKGALQEADALLLLGEILKCHAPKL
jgi:hypothetical protein